MKRYKPYKFNEGHDSWERFTPDELTEKTYKDVIKTIKRLKSDPQVVFLCMVESENKFRYNNFIYYSTFNIERYISMSHFSLYSTVVAEKEKRYPEGLSGIPNFLPWIYNNKNIIEYIKNIHKLPHHENYNAINKNFKIIKNITKKTNFFRREETELLYNTLKEALNLLQKKYNRSYPINIKTLKLIINEDLFNERQNLVSRNNYNNHYNFWCKTNDITKYFKYFEKNVGGVYKINNKILLEIMNIFSKLEGELN